MTELVPSTGARAGSSPVGMTSVDTGIAPVEPAGTTQPATKRKRQIKAETGGKQAKLAFGGGKAQLRVSDDEEAVTVGEPSKSKPRKRKDQGEEAERKAMAARNKAAKKAEAQAIKAANKVRRKSRNQPAKDQGPETITILSSSPARETSPQNVKSGPRSRASTADTLVVGPESASGPFSIVIDSDGEEAEGSMPKHPFFVRKTASGGVDDPIHLAEDDSAKPKMMRVTESRPAHSFFSNKVSGASTPMERQASNTSTTGKKKPKKDHNFFAPSGQSRPHEDTAMTKPGWGNDVKEGQEWLPPWPTVDGHQVWPTIDSSAELPLPTRKGKERAHVHEDFWDRHLARSANNMSPQRRYTTSSANSIFPYISSHPALAAICSRKQSNEDWCHKYAPMTAEQVLGNEIEASYLRDWVLALQVGTVTDTDETQTIIRSVSRPTKRNAGSSWIAYDDDPVEGYEDREAEETVEGPQPRIPSDQWGRPNLYPSLSDRLTNTIVLTGQSGTGKTAAVYAAAHELGWDVFEVYPGIGKRNASSLASLVGEVSRNHMVAKGGRSDTKGAIKASATIDLTAESKIGYLSDRDTAAPAKARQSVILLEEVDILYEDDKNFWQAVLTLIAESRRPVILTCNDLSLVPCSQLPLQTILRFETPPSYLMIPYLESIAFNEHTSYISPAIRHTPTALQPHHPLPPRNSQMEATNDLRQSLHQLQLGLELNRDDSAYQLPDGLDTAVKQLDNLSYADAWIAQRPLSAQETLETDVYMSSANDEVGHKLLYKPPVASSLPILPSQGREAEISAFLCSASQDDRLRQLATDRATHMASTLSFLDELVALDSYLLPAPCLFLDYIPPIRRIVQADDMLEAAHRAAAASGEEITNRRTGRPMRLTNVLPGRAEFIRYLDLSAHALEDARSGFLV